MFYRRHLPHWQKPDSALFITWRLYGSLPRKTLTATRGELAPGKKFQIFDRELDRAAYGPTWLKDVRLAQLVADSVRKGCDEMDLYRLCAYVVMSNHVHVLLWPHKLQERITKSGKGYTARECNKLLKRTGTSFW